MTDRVFGALIRTCLISLMVAGNYDSVLAQERAASFLPASCVAYVEISDPAKLVHSVVDHPLHLHLQGMEPYRKALESQQYRNFLTGRKFLELQVGSDWRTAFDQIAARGIVAAYDNTHKGWVVLVRCQDESVAENFRAKLLELTRLKDGEVQPARDYRGVPVYRLDKGGALVIRDWVLASDKSELGQAVADRLLGDDAKEPTLADNAEFQEAGRSRPADANAWGFLNMKAVRESEAAAKALEQQAENPLAELLIGGIQSVLRSTNWVASDLTVREEGVEWNFQTPFDGTWIPEQRAYYFGTDQQGKAPTLPACEETLLTIAAYRDVSAMWVRAGDLFNEQMNDQLAEADANLSTIFAGRDFGEEILGSFAPEIGVIAVRQSFQNQLPAPAIRLPAFALVLRLRDPETMRAELRRTFQSAIGFFNIVGAQNGQPQLEMDMQKIGETDMITSRYLPEKKDRESTAAPIIFNFSPSVSFHGDRFVLASTSALAQTLGTAEEQGAQDSNTAVNLNADVLEQVLADNREQLISRNMLEDGNTREEAEAAIALLLEAVGCFKGAGLELGPHDKSLRLTIHLDVNPNIAQAPAR